MHFLSALTLLFIALKLTGVIAWPWLAVLAPLWVGFLASLLALVIVCAYAAFLRRYRL